MPGLTSCWEAWGWPTRLGPICASSPVRIAMLKAGRIVALDRTSDLLKAASGNVLRFKTTGELPAALAARARVTGSVVQLPAHNALEIEQYLAAVRESGLVVENVEMRKADLEDVFIDIMGRNTPAALEVATT